MMLSLFFKFFLPNPQPLAEIINGVGPCNIEIEPQYIKEQTAKTIVLAVCLNLLI